MTDPNDLTPPPELLKSLWKVFYRASLYDTRGAWTASVNAAFRAGADQELEACCKLLELSDSNAREFLYAARRPQPQPSLKEQALVLVDNLRICDHLSPRHQDIIRRALESLPEDPAVPPAADDRGPGSVAEQASPVATDKHIADVFERIAGWRYNYPHTLAALRAIYDLGREHGANSKPTPNPSQIRSSSPAPTADSTATPAAEPAAAPDRPLWDAMSSAYDDVIEMGQGCRHGYAAELRVVADELERRQMKQVFQDLDDVIDWLRTEADRAEAGEQ